MERVHVPASVDSGCSLKQQKLTSRCGGWKSNSRVSAGLVPSGLLPPPIDGLILHVFTLSSLRAPLGRNLLFGSGH